MAFDWTTLVPWGQSVISGAVGAAIALVGTRASDARQMRRDTEERRAARRDAVRAVVAELIESGLEFGYQGQTYTLVYTPPPGVELPFEEKEAKHAELRTTRLRHMRAISMFLLTVSDPEPARKVQSLADRMEKMQQFTGPIISAGIAGREQSGPQILAMLRYFEQYMVEVVDLRAVLAEVTAEPLGEDN